MENYKLLDKAISALENEIRKPEKENWNLRTKKIQDIQNDYVNLKYYFYTSYEPEDFSFYKNWILEILQEINSEENFEKFFKRGDEILSNTKAAKKRPFE